MAGCAGRGEVKEEFSQRRKLLAQLILRAEDAELLFVNSASSSAISASQRLCERYLEISKITKTGEEKMDEKKKLLEKIFAQLDELSDNYKGETEPAAFLEQLRTWVKENADNEIMNNKEKYLREFIRKTEDFSEPWSDSVIGDVFTDIYDWADWVKSGGDEEDDEEDSLRRGECR